MQLQTKLAEFEQFKKIISKFKFTFKILFLIKYIFGLFEKLKSVLF